MRRLRSEAGVPLLAAWLLATAAIAQGGAARG